MKSSYPYSIDRLALLVAAGLLTALIGCRSEEPDRTAVHGSITFQGKPIPAGTIVFEPDASRGNQGPTGFASITDGLYDTRDGGKGVRPGAVVVWVSGFDGVNRANTDSGMGKPLCSMYKTTGEITAPTTSLDVEIPANHR